MKSTHSSNLPLWLALILTLAMVIFVRETAVLVCQWAGIEKAANIVGLVAMFVVLMAWRLLKGLPSWLTQASNTLLVDSGFAFLPVSAGAGLLLFALGDELWGVMLTMLISTLIPLWGLALLANRWLNQDSESNSNSDSDSQADDTGSITSKQ
ncbi:CidA/LrgA family protein [Psychrobacter celer]|uniref:CidA/LrgA family protein n=1 Tax=Psychrobacter TaxID=497 RepID=UPI000946D0FD|nr:CidA/LrgA family protein [Psychrobacter sp. Rd 27.2]OLF40401.1 CidA/LrgA family protein [Psychrobacter sp. Rd 27.2]